MRFGAGNGTLKKNSHNYCLLFHHDKTRSYFSLEATQLTWTIANTHTHKTKPTLKKATHYNAKARRQMKKGFAVPRLNNKRVIEGEKN